MGCEVVTHHDPSRHLTLGPKRVFFSPELQQKYSKLLRQVLGDEWFEVGKNGGNVADLPPH